MSRVSSKSIQGDVVQRGIVRLTGFIDIDNDTYIDRILFLCDVSYRLFSAHFFWTDNATDYALRLTKCTGTQAAGSGTSMFSADLSLNTGASVPPKQGALSTVEADLRLAAGDRVGLDFVGPNPAALEHLIWNIILVPVNDQLFRLL